MFEMKTNIAPANSTKKYEATQNACKLCTPLGACLAFKGINNAITLLHGSQGCSTYIRRYMISHFREPIDIASSNFSEDTAVYGGEKNLLTALDNIITQYNPDVIGVPSTCLSETIGDDVKMMIKNVRQQLITEEGIFIVPVSTPSYSGTHSDGFYLAVKSLVENFSGRIEKNYTKQVNVFQPMLSPADIRFLKEILSDFGFDGIVFPDYSDTLDGGTWNSYEKIPSGGTTIQEMKNMSSAVASIEFGYVAKEKSGAAFLNEKYDVISHNVSIPIGIKSTDRFFEILEKISDHKTPQKYINEKKRLIDSYIDGHKYLFGKKALIYGEEDFVLAIAQFLLEIGIQPAICATGSTNKSFHDKINTHLKTSKLPIILDDSDFENIRQEASNSGIDIMIGNSKGYKIARELKVPLVRVGFPIHDRIGTQRTLHIGYRGTQELFDKITNAILEQRQADSSIGYSYL